MRGGDPQRQRQARAQLHQLVDGLRFRVHPLLPQHVPEQRAGRVPAQLLHLDPPGPVTRRWPGHDGVDHNPGGRPAGL